jgi:molybdenum cofactor cytidylyltransferase
MEDTDQRKEAKKIISVPFSLVAIVPAAGRSDRMGRPKLILPVRGIPLIARVVAALRDGGASRVVVVAPSKHEPGAMALIESAEREGAEVVVPDRPTLDMRASVELGLNRLGEGLEPTALLLTPGDIPGLTPEAVARVIEASIDSPGRIIVPRHEGRRGHPLLLPWPLAREIPLLPPGVGVNALLAEHGDEIEYVRIDDPELLDDVDTPDDYRRWS